MLSRGRILAIAHEKLNVHSVAGLLLELQIDGFSPRCLIQSRRNLLCINVKMMYISGDQLNRAYVSIQ